MSTTSPNTMRHCCPARGALVRQRCRTRIGRSLAMCRLPRSGVAGNERRCGTARRAKGGLHRLVVAADAERHPVARNRRAAGSAPCRPQQRRDPPGTLQIDRRRGAHRAELWTPEGEFEPKTQSGGTTRRKAPQQKRRPGGRRLRVMPLRLANDCDPGQADHQQRDEEDHAEDRAEAPVVLRRDVAAAVVHGARAGRVRRQDAHDAERQREQ